MANLEKSPHVCCCLFSTSHAIIAAIHFNSSKTVAVQINFQPKTRFGLGRTKCVCRVCFFFNRKRVFFFRRFHTSTKLVENEHNECLINEKMKMDSRVLSLVLIPLNES